MPKYQGHRNWNHWNVSLWLCNDYELYCLVQMWMGTPTLTRNDCAHRILSEVPSHTPDGAPYTFTSIRAALVGWER